MIRVFNAENVCLYDIEYTIALRLIPCTGFHKKLNTPWSHMPYYGAEKNLLPY